jgi:hypothetical protein
VSGGVGVLGAEGRTEGVDLAHGQAERLDIELAGNGQKGLAAKKVTAEINVSGIGARQVHQVKGRHPEHLAGTFGV